MSLFGIRGELLPEWDVLSTGETLIFRANTQDAFIRVCKADIVWKNDELGQTARAYVKKMGGKKTTGRNSLENSGIPLLLLIFPEWQEGIVS